MRAPRDAHRQRMTAEERRAAVLETALQEFATKGLHGASTEEIAARTGISHSYLFKLFGTKKELFLAVTERAYDRIEWLIREGAREHPEDALGGMGKRLQDLLGRRDELLMLLQGFAAASDSDVAHTVQRRWEQAGRVAEEVSGVSDERMDTFWERTMMWMVGTAIYQDKPDGDE